MSGRDRPNTSNTRNEAISASQPLTQLPPPWISEQQQLAERQSAGYDAGAHRARSSAGATGSSTNVPVPPQVGNRMVNLAASCANGGSGSSSNASAAVQTFEPLSSTSTLDLAPSPGSDDLSLELLPA